MAIYQQIAVRLQASLVSSPVAPIDLNTGQEVKIWRAQNLGMAVGIFDASGNPVNLSNLVSLTLTIQPAQDSIIPSISSSLLASDSAIIPLITTQGWQSGLAQNGVFNLTKAQTDLSLGGESQAEYWLQLSGVTSAGEAIIYAAGNCSFFDPGPTVAIPPFGYVSRNAQTNSSGNATISPASLDHTEILTVNGAARTSAIILSVVGMSDGALCRIRWLLTAATDIILNVLNGTAEGSTINTVTTGSTLNGYCLYCYNEADATWEILDSSFPSTY